MYSRAPCGRDCPPPVIGTRPQGFRTCLTSTQPSFIPGTPLRLRMAAVPSTQGVATSAGAYSNATFSLSFRHHDTAHDLDHGHGSTGYNNGCRVTMDFEMTQPQVLGLRELILDGLESIHAGVEAVARQDAVRRISATQLQSIARGIEILGKATYITNVARITRRLPTLASMKTVLGHRVTQIVAAIADQAASHEVDGDRYDVAFLRSDSVLSATLSICEDFGQQGRYSHINAVVGGGDTSMTYLAWNEVQSVIVQSVRASGREMQSSPSNTDYYVSLRSESVRTLQRLMRSFARQILDASDSLEFGHRPINQVQLSGLSGLDDDALPIPFPIAEDCRCQESDDRLRVWIYSPVVQSAGSPEGRTGER